MGILKRIADRLEARAKRNKQREIKRAQEEREMFHRIEKGEPPQSPIENLYKMAYSEITKARILTCSQGVVIYKFNYKLGNTLSDIFLEDIIEDAEKKLAETLAANPKVDLTKVAPALGITIIDDQRTKSPKSHRSIIIGDNEDSE